MDVLSASNLEGRDSNSSFARRHDHSIFGKKSLHEFGQSQEQIFRLFSVPILRASAVVSGRGLPVDSGRSKAANPATIETDPISTIGNGIQKLDVSST